MVKALNFSAILFSALNALIALKSSPEAFRSIGGTCPEFPSFENFGLTQEAILDVI